MFSVMWTEEKQNLSDIKVALKEREIYEKKIENNQKKLQSKPIHHQSYPD